MMNNIIFALEQKPSIVTIKKSRIDAMDITELMELMFAQQKGQIKIVVV